LCLLHRLAKLFKMDQINSDTKRNWYWVMQKKINQQIEHGSECWSMITPRGDKKCEDWKRRYMKMLFVINSVQLIQWIPYQWSFWRIWRCQNRRTSNLHCEVCRWLCATG
jgi:hypothetical protein